MAEFPYMPLFTDAFLADTGDLNAQETGAYLLLLMIAWRSPGCCIADDDVKLARWTRLDLRTWRRIKPTVMAYWDLCDGLWQQRRLSKERSAASKRAEVARKNGKQGRRPKSLENNDTENPAGSSRVTQEKASIPIPIKKEDSEAKASAADAAPAGPVLEGEIEVVGEDPTAKLFRLGKTILASFGVAERRTGALIGQWLKQRPDPVGLLAAIQFARDRNVAEPVAYISAVLNSGKSGNGHGRKHGQSLAELARDMAEEARQRERAAGTGGAGELF